MLRILVKADAAVIWAAAGVLWRVAAATGLTWPFFLMAWRAAFWVPLFVLSAFVAANEGTASSYAALGFATVLAEVSRRHAAGLWADSRKEWTPDLFSRYALIAFAKRESLFAFRLLAAFHVVALAILALIVAHGAEGLSGPLWAVLYMASVIAVGGWIEAALPPPAGTGEKEEETFAVPEAA